ncbi:MAG: methyltransferase domain-containing protein [Sulfolobales archaeon]
MRTVRLVVDMGLSELTARITDSGVILGDSHYVGFDELSIVEEGFAYKVVSSKLVRIDMFEGNKYYKLKPVAPRKAPTLEINGIQMHRSTYVDPWTDTLLKVSTLGNIAGADVLDVCTGLGYTAIAEVKMGARRVVTIEVDPNVLEIAQYNPWSKGLEDSRVEVILSDATEYVKRLESDRFDAILHDPPRISVAGELYSLDFYRELYRVLKPGRRLFHYVGEPGKHGSVSYRKGIKNRLEAVGFTSIRWIDEAKGFLAVKPRLS